MSDLVTIDASVFVNAFSKTEEGSDKSWKFITELRENSITILAPVLLLPEVTASIARKQNNTELALQLMEEIRNYPNITFIEMDISLAEQSADLAARHRLRGSDAVYAAVAKRFATELVTLDAEQLQRAKKAVKVRRP